ncbi:uncharacterized protein LOC127857993 isoform X2 [Dreissena polymorpha]|nr:uncharacterized protein LOC127857993 isoform X2 [Dreissena polymorpha]XP_052250780.1 uncharacterized protein LOC127857993 isoform X2 [Dreissena polymorpha]
MSEWFQHFDKNDDKKLDKDELKRVFHALCWVVTDEEFEKIFATADLDANGYIDYDEYLHLLSTFRKDPATERLELIEAFRHFDKDRSGTIEKSELRRFLLSKDMAFNSGDHRLLDKLLSKVDTNGDGKIDIEEFVTMMMEKPDMAKLKKF